VEIRFKKGLGVVLQNKLLKPKFRTYGIMISSSGSEPSSGFIFHDKKIAAVENQEASNFRK